MGTRTISIRSQIGVAALLCVIAPVAFAQQDDLVVVCDGAGCGAFELFLPDALIFNAADGETLDDAMIFATDPTNNINTVQITEGTWPFVGAPDIVEPITVQGVGDPAQIIVQNTGTNPTFPITGMDIVIEGITITAGVGSGVSVDMGSNAVINRCIITGNNGDGISVMNDAAPIIVNCAFSKHTGGAGVRVNTTVGQTEIAHCTFVENQTGVAAESGNVRIRASLFEDMTGNAIDVTGGTAGGSDNLYFNNAGGELVALGMVAPEASILPEATPTLRWFGQIDPDVVTPVPALDAVTMPLDADPIVGEYVVLDLDGNVRPINGTPDIGADEGGLGIAGTPALTFVAYYPNPIGRLDAGDLAIAVRFSAAVNLISFDDPNFPLDESSKIILWPQSLVGDHMITFNPPESAYNTVAVGDYAIPMNMEIVTDDYWIGTNAVPISADLRDTGTGALIQAGHGYDADEIYLDGVADLLVHIGTGPGSGQLLDSTQLLVDTVDLQPIIDTHPPRLFIPPSLTGLKPGPLGELITGPGNDNVSATIINADRRAGAPVPAPFNFPAGATWTFTEFQEIEPSPFASGPSVFYNIDADYSLGEAFPAQPTVPQNLSHSVTAEFIDLPPVDTNGDPILVIIPSGFQPALDATFSGTAPITVDELAGDVSRGFLMPRWIFQTGLSKLTSPQAAPLTVDATFVDTPFTVGADTFPGLTATWDLNNLGYALANNDADPFRYRINFAGIDAAFNIPSSDDELLDPLSVWWIVRTESQIIPTNWDSEFLTPNFTWRLKRNADPGLSNTTEPARPAFAYRFLISVNPQNPDGPYAPLNGPFFGIDANAIATTGWSSQYSYGTGLSFNWFEQNGFTANPQLTDRWLILLTTAIDEAGNVEALPYNELTPDIPGPTGLVRLSPGGPLNPTGAERYIAATGPDRNWVRFYIPGAGAALDTGNLNGTITATFWHEKFVVNPLNGAPDGNESIFPQAHIVPLPPAGEFDPLDLITAVFRERTEVRFDIGFSSEQTSGTIGFIWVLERDGVPIDQDVSATYFAADGPQMESLLVPRTNPDPSFPPNPLTYMGDGNRERAVNYVLKAATVRYPGGGVVNFNDILRGPDGYFIFEAPASGLYEIDETPVNYAFTVTPDVPDFIENKTSPDNQPVKLIEAN